ncbi:carbamoyltransferase, partial [bacterium]|nr:carbamoyltransferase [bacterium]
HGNAYSADEIKKELDRQSISYHCPQNINRSVAELLAKGKVVARFDGAMEYGPRALGNRSILYHCGDPTVNDWLNHQLNRTEFMPFAPVTLQEYAEDRYLGYIGAQQTAKFMTITFKCTDLMQEESPAVVHVDKTARPQIIARENNPGYYDLIDTYRELTGIPTLVNTSFNMHEEPIVRTPVEAIQAFEASKLDALIAGPYLVTRK